MSARKKRQPKKKHDRRPPRRYPRVVAAATKTVPGAKPGEGQSAQAVALARDIQVEELKVRIFNLKRAGASYKRIASELKVSAGYAHKVVDAGLEEIAAELGHSKAAYRVLDLERVDSMLIRLADLIRVKPTVGYFFAYKSFLERRAKLLGLDMPTKLEWVAPGDERELSDVELEERAAALREQLDAARQRVATPALQQSQTPERA